jgi:GMP synthase-like glutamine amidotransferase
MKIQYIRHVPFEDLAGIQTWAGKHGHIIKPVKLYKGGKLPEVLDFDWLIILGGPMNIYEEDKYPWLKEEKKFIKKAVDEKKVVLGICLGAQIISDVLGGHVTKNKHKEIGIFPVHSTKEAKNTTFGCLPEIFDAFHWHGDTFSIPPGAVKTAWSVACDNQAFEYNGRVIGLQFHLESTYESIKRLIKYCKEDMTPGEFVQSPEKILSEFNFEKMNDIMEKFLDNIEQKTGKQITY